MAPSESLAAAPFVKRRARRHALTLSRGGVELFSVAFLAYFGLGLYTTVQRHVIAGDAESRLTHAYDVFWNAPAKLTALGFVWPPLMSAVFLPLTVVKPVATSLWALPLMTAFCGAGLLVTLDRTLRESGMRAVERAPIVLLFGLNPMVAAYSANGMSEILAQWLLALAVLAFVRWHRDRLPRQLVVVGIFMTLGTLVRYELALWLGVLLPAIGLLVIDKPRRKLEFEASVVAVLAPVLYALGVWTLLNWQILGTPFSWLHEETTQTFVDTRVNQHVDFGLLHVIVFTVRENAALFPVLFVVAAALIAFGIGRRDLMSGVLALAILLNVATTVGIAYLTHTPHIYELRFNVRTMPLAIIGVGWMYRSMASQAARTALVVGTVLCLALSAPATWHTMRTFPYRLDERQFTEALTTGRDQGHEVVAIDPIADQAMAHYVLANIHSRDAILTDDSQTYGVILRSGRPDLFADRIDHGDANWLQLAARPYEKVKYMLFSSGGIDMLGHFYPLGIAGAPFRGARLLYRTRTSRLYEIVAPLH